MVAKCCKAQPWAVISTWKCPAVPRQVGTSKATLLCSGHRRGSHQGLGRGVSPPASTSLLTSQGTNAVLHPHSSGRDPGHCPLGTHTNSGRNRKCCFLRKAASDPSSPSQRLWGLMPATPPSPGGGPHGRSLRVWSRQGTADPVSALLLLPHEQGRGGPARKGRPGLQATSTHEGPALLK